MPSSSAPVDAARGLASRPAKPASGRDATLTD
jgi:hypothetical protein